MPPPARSCHLGANQEGGMFYGRTAQVQLLSTAAALHCATGEKAESRVGSKKIPSLLISLFFSASGLKHGTAGQ